MNDELALRLQFFFRQGAVARSVQTFPGLAVGSLKGPVREDNQDRAAAAYIVPASSPALLVAAVCDGMGGMSDGGAAASTALSYFLAELADLSGSLSSDRLRKAIGVANLAVFGRFGGSGGSTITALVVQERGEAWVVHVGDSRLYAVEANGELSLLTSDDTIEGVVKGHGANEDALDNRLLQFVGIGDQMDPHILRVEHTRQRNFILTSDGAHGVGRKMLEGIIRHSRDPQDWVRRLTYVAEAASVEDNSSVVALSAPRFTASPKFHGGTSMTVWSPTSALELWLQTNEIASPNLDASQAVQLGAVQESAPKSKRAPKKGPKRSGPKAPPADKNEGSGKPQLSISFGAKKSAGDD